MNTPGKGAEPVICSGNRSLQMATIVLITDAFPYGSVTENSFISPEIEALSNAFDRVIIAPIRKIREELDVMSLPANVELSNSLLIKPSLIRKFDGLKRYLKPVLYDLKHSDSSFREVVAYSSYVGICLKNICRLIREEKLDLENTLFYTFWFNFTTAALSLIKGAKVITRTHGYDLYEDRYFISPWWRKQSLDMLAGCYTVSGAGREYLLQRYPYYSDKIFLSKLGTPTHEDRNPDNAVDADGSSSAPARKLSLLGVARVSPEKGVKEQFELIREYARNNCDKRIRYVHIGDGILMDQLRSMATEVPENLSVELKGALHNSEVHEIMRTTHFDSMILLSHTEGGCPIAICEALSYGIPCIATSVGGITEMLNHGGGVLLNPDPDFDSFSDAIKLIEGEPTLYRERAYQTWERWYKAEDLRLRFAKEIRSLID